MIGREATDAFRDAFIAHWRAWKPWIRSGRKIEELSQMRYFNSMGIAAITIEAPSFGVAQDLANGSDNITELLAPIAIDEIERNENMPSRPLSLLLSIAQRAQGGQRGRLKSIAAARFRTSTESDRTTQYAAALFTLDARAATKLLIERLDALAIDDQAALVQRVLPRVFGGHFGRDEVIVENFPLE